MDVKSVLNARIARKKERQALLRTQAANQPPSQALGAGEGPGEGQPPVVAPALVAPATRVVEVAPVEVHDVTEAAGKVPAVGNLPSSPQALRRRSSKRPRSQGQDSAANERRKKASQEGSVAAPDPIDLPMEVLPAPPSPPSSVVPSPVIGVVASAPPPPAAPSTVRPLSTPPVTSNPQPAAVATPARLRAFTVALTSSARPPSPPTSANTSLAGIFWWSTILPFPPAPGALDTLPSQAPFGASDLFSGPFGGGGATLPQWGTCVLFGVR